MVTVKSGSPRPLSEAGARYSGLRDFGVSELAGFVNVLVGKADIRWPGQFFCTGRIRVSGLTDFTPLLGRVILIGQTALRHRFNFERIGLGTMGGSRRVLHA